MIEHLPWVGRDYASGISGQRIAIVGHSHHREEADPDTPDMTLAVMRGVVEQGWRLGFFTQIEGYFPPMSDFWQRVMFFNYLPACIGTSDRRYDRGSPEQIALARTRLHRLMAEHKPHKLMVFTNAHGKGWPTFPPVREVSDGSKAPSLGPAFPGFTWGTYETDGHRVMAFGLRHPQGARGDTMRAAVQCILTDPRFAI